MWNPWRRLRELGHVGLAWQDADDEYGHIHHGASLITITSGMTQAERRSTLTHELIHLERGPAVAGYGAVEEREVARLTAERLIPFDDLVEALFWCYDEVELAEYFHVDEEVVVDRLTNLTDAENRHIDAEMDRREKSFGGGC